MRPCDEGKKCIHKHYYPVDNYTYCDIDETGDDCPYEKPWGKRRYERENLRGGTVPDIDAK